MSRVLVSRDVFGALVSKAIQSSPDEEVTLRIMLPQVCGFDQERYGSIPMEPLSFVRLAHDGGLRLDASGWWLAGILEVPTIAVIHSIRPGVLTISQVKLVEVSAGSCGAAGDVLCEVPVTVSVRKGWLP